MNKIRAYMRYGSTILAYTCFAVGLLAGCAQQPKSLESSAPKAQTHTNPVVETEFHIMAGEWALSQGRLNPAAYHYTRAAEYTNSIALSELAAQIALSGGDRESKYAATKQWARAMPTNIKAQQAAARMAFVNNHPEQLEQYCKNILSLSESRQKGAQIVAEVLSDHAEQQQLALDTAQALIDDQPEHYERYYILALLALRYDQQQQARQATRTLIQHIDDWPKATLLRAAVLIIDGKTQQASQQVEQIKGSADQRSHYQALLAQLLLEKGYADEGLAAYKKALKITPDNNSMRLEYAMAALNSRHFDIAADEFETLYKKDPNDLTAYYLGATKEQQNQDKSAKQWYQKVGDGDYKLEANIRIQAIQARHGKLKQARRELEQMRHTYPSQQARLYEAEGGILYAAQEYKAAMDVYSEGHKLEPDNADILYGRALAAEQIGRISQARQDLEAALENNPGEPQLLNGLGYLLTNHTKDYKKAHAYIVHALQQDPHNPAYLDSMGWVLYKLGHLDQALKFLQKAYSQYPDSEVAAHLGEVLWQQGKKQKARDVWQKALDKYPNSQKILDTQKRLENGQ